MSEAVDRVRGTVREVMRRKDFAQFFPKHLTHILADYNTEVSRGIAHTQAWDEQMAELQRAFNKASIAWHEANGRTVI